MRLVIVGIVAAIVVGAGHAKADFFFGEPTNLGPNINSPGDEMNPCISPDGLEFYFSGQVAKRQTAEDPWGTAAIAQVDFRPSCISADGLEGYLHDGGPGALGEEDIWVTTRDTTQDDWGPPVNLGPPVNSPYTEFSPSISSDGLSLFFSDGDWTDPRPGGHGQSDIWVSTRATKEAPWGEPVNLGPPVNSAEHDTTPSLSADGLTLVFGRGSFFVADIWLTRRKTTDDPWEAPIRLGLETGNDAWGGHPYISFDGSTIYWTSWGRTGGFGGADIWQVSISPLVDFNGDGKVDGFEFTKVVDHWGQNELSCDVSPMPMGNGTVDVQDLIALSEYIGKDIDDPTLIAHWALDETEGNIAHDSAGQNDAEVMGSAVWQPAGGIVDGALLLDGVDDRVATEYVRDPSDGQLSVFMWIRGGAPGQVLVSQVQGENWLLADSSSGSLMTELKESGRDGRALSSETVIADGNWHRVGLVWDLTNRTIYVDDVMVATDTQSDLVGTNGGLNIGCGKNLSTGTFWSGLIDDVRIYSRSVKP